MYKIKDNLTRLAVKLFFTDKEIDEAYRKQLHDRTDYIMLQKFGNNSVRIDNIDIHIAKSEFTEANKYEPNEWNNFPDIVPPEPGSYITIADMTNLTDFSYVIDYWTGTCWINTNNNNVRAYRAIPKYKAK